MMGAIKASVGGVLNNAGLTTVVKEKEKKLSVKYAKEFFVTEKGEVIKMAAIVSQDPDIQMQLKA